ncbi:MAG: hypothetical protein BroJett025_10080 [Patescibacteria group bacterium]|nr:MAG: hypothetical protein BroJett025_10080 [Patescibacteria group bacterium]
MNSTVLQLSELKETKNKPGMTIKNSDKRNNFKPLFSTKFLLNKKGRLKKDNMIASLPKVNKSKV